MINNQLKSNSRKQFMHRIWQRKSHLLFIVYCFVFRFAICRFQIME
jgi:hypothetical protein